MVSIMVGVRLRLAVGLLLGASLGATAALARPVVLVAGGDIMPVQATAAVIARSGADYPFAEIGHLLRAGDLAVANMEAPLTTRGAPTTGKSPDDLASGRDYLFRGAPEVAAALARAGVRVVSLANNHAMDYGPVGLLDTLAYLERAGIMAVGAGRTLAEARAARVVTVRGTRLAFLSYSDVLPRLSVATRRTPGIAPARGYWTGRPAEDEIAADVRAARPRADHVVVLMHWGIAGRTVPTCRQAALADRILAAGATVILGHHPHVLQPVVVRNRRLVAYSLGNLISSPRDSLASETAVLQITLGREGVIGWGETPLRVNAGRARVAPPPAAAAIHSRLRSEPACLRLN